MKMTFYYSKSSIFVNDRYMKMIVQHLPLAIFVSYGNSCGELLVAALIIFLRVVIKKLKLNKI